MSHPSVPAMAGVMLATAVLGKAADEHWTPGIDESVSHETVRTLSQESADAIPDEYAVREVHPVLEFRCSPRTGLRFRIDWRRFISSFNTEVGFRVDGGSATWLKLGVDASNRITLAKSAEDTATLIENLAGGKSLNVEVAPYSEPSVSVDFDVSTLGNAMEKLGASCN